MQGGKQSTQLEGCRVQLEGFVGSVSECVSLRFVRCLVGLRVRGLRVGASAVSLVAFSRVRGSTS